MQAYQRACGEVIERYDGHVAQYLGDGLMVYFGWPSAHEDDAVRAIRAGLEVAASGLQARRRRHRSVRGSGIHTGLVVVGETGRGDASIPKAAVGETPNIAARLQGLAEPGSVVVSERTTALAGGLFDFADLGAQALKGVSEPVQLFKVVGARATSIAASMRPTARWRSHLWWGARKRWRCCCAAGSRLATVKDKSCWSAASPASASRGSPRCCASRSQASRTPRLRYQCSPYHLNSALYPIIEQFEFAAGFTREDTAEQKLDKMEAVLAGSARAGRRSRRRCLRRCSRCPPSAIRRSSSRRRSRRRRRWRRWPARSKRWRSREPVLMVFEDAHWIDPTSQEVARCAGTSAAGAAHFAGDHLPARVHAALG